VLIYKLVFAGGVLLVLIGCKSSPDSSPPNPGTPTTITLGSAPASTPTDVAGPKIDPAKKETGTWTSIGGSVLTLGSDGAFTMDQKEYHVKDSFVDLKLHEEGSYTLTGNVLKVTLTKADLTTTDDKLKKTYDDAVKAADSIGKPLSGTLDFDGKDSANVTLPLPDGVPWYASLDRKV